MPRTRCSSRFDLSFWAGNRHAEAAKNTHDADQTDEKERSRRRQRFGTTWWSNSAARCFAAGKTCAPLTLTLS